MNNNDDDNKPEKQRLLTTIELISNMLDRFDNYNYRDRHDLGLYIYSRLDQINREIYALTSYLESPQAGLYN